MNYMHVLVIPTWYPNGDDKLIGIYHKEFTENLVKNKGIKANMLYVDRQKISHPIKYLLSKKKEVIKEKNYTIYMRKNFDIRRLSYKLQMNNYYKCLEKAFLDYVKIEGKPDVLHAHVTLPAGYAVCKLGKKYNIPVVVTEHATYYERFFKEEDNKVYSKYVLDNSYYTTVSNYMKDYILSFHKQCDVLPNLVDADNFKVPRKKVKGLKLVTVVGLRKIKRVDDIIKSLKVLIEEKGYKDATLTVVGARLDKDYYLNICHELKMNKYVKFVGKKNKKQIANILSKSNIYVMSSSLETFGIPGVEALLSGIPVVATKCLGPEEYVEEENGKLVEIGNIDEMVNAIDYVYKHLDNYKVSTLRNSVKRYSAKEVTKKAISIYKSLIK